LPDGTQKCTPKEEAGVLADFTDKQIQILKPVLLVEDKPDDRDLIVRALRRANCPLSIHAVATGRQALDYVHGQGIYADRREYPIPVVLLVDWQLPDMNGTDLVQQLRSGSQTRWAPMILITGNQAPDIAVAAYRAGASAVLSKPHSMAELEQQMTTVCDFWLRWCRLP
jgi:two-component system response regulator